jgi:hypothetical protein
MSDKSQVGRDPLDRLASIAVIAMAIAVIFMAVRQFVERPSIPAGHAGAQELVGQSAPATDLKVEDGTSLSLPTLGSGYVMVYQHTSCVFCQVSVPAWQALAADCSLPVILVSLEEPSVQRLGYDIKALGQGDCGVVFSTPIDPVAFQLAYRARRTPLHYAVDRDGVIGKIRIGALAADDPSSPAIADSLRIAASGG